MSMIILACKLRRDLARLSAVVTLIGLLVLPPAATAGNQPCTRQQVSGTGPTCVVDPLATDPKVTRVIDEDAVQHHRVWRHRGDRARRLLLVFLPGSGSTDTVFDTFASQAAEDGFDVIVLAYPNERTISSYCEGLAKTGADECWAQSRGEVSFGASTSVPAITAASGYAWPNLDVSASDSIVNRLVKVLDYLDAHSEHLWREYLRADPGSPYGGKLPRANRIVIAGHSQGGGHAAFLAHRMRFDRVLTFAAPADYHTTDFTSVCTPAAWLSTPSKTPNSRYYAFEDTHSFTFGCDKPAWDAMGYQGAPAITNVDTAGISDANRSHELVTEDDGSLYPNAVTDGCKRHAHSCVIKSDSTPATADGTPIFGPVWRFMYGAPKR